MNDPWKHRGAGMTCATCMWYVPKVAARPEVDAVGVGAAAAELLAPRPEVGRCRRHAPSMGGYPVVFGADWCGDHKLDENKVTP